MVFIQLLRHQIEGTLEFLSTVPGPTGKSALDYILNEWCAKHSSFVGGYEIISRWVLFFILFYVFSRDLKFQFRFVVCFWCFMVESDMGTVNATTPRLLSQCQSIYGFSSDAICKLLLYAVATNDVRFEDIYVNGDEIISGEGILFIIRYCSNVFFPPLFNITLSF